MNSTIGFDVFFFRSIEAKWTDVDRGVVASMSVMISSNINTTNTNSSVTIIDNNHSKCPGQIIIVIIINNDVRSRVQDINDSRLVVSSLMISDVRLTRNIRNSDKFGLLKITTPFGTEALMERMLYPMTKD